MQPQHIFSDFSNQEQFSVGVQIEGLGTIKTSRHQKNKKKIKGYFFDSSEEIINILGDAPEDLQMPQPKKISYDSINYLDYDQLLQYLTSCGEQITPAIKKKIIKVRNKNVHYFLTKTKNRYVIQTCKKLLQALKVQKKIKDPTKSFTFFFIQLALLREYSGNQQFFQIFDQMETKKKNKNTKKCTPEQLSIIAQEMKFTRQIAQLFYIDPERAILTAYLRNHSVKKIQQGKLDKWTRDGIIDTCKTLNSLPFNYGLKINLPPLK